jgi:hypothetical protein
VALSSGKPSCEDCASPLSDGDSDGAIESRLNDLEKRVSALEKSPSKSNNQSKAKSSKTNASGWKNKANWRALRNGMTENEVRQLLGEAGKITSNQYTVTWDYNYPMGGSVSFDPKSMSVEAWSE